MKIDALNTATKEIYEDHSTAIWMKMKHFWAQAREQTLCFFLFFVFFWFLRFFFSSWCLVYSSRACVPLGADPEVSTAAPRFVIVF